MARRLLHTLAVGLAAGALAAAGALTTPTVVAAAPAPEKHAAAVDYTGILALNNCSGALVRVPGSSDDDPALALTNGHCSEKGMPDPGTVNVNQPSSRTFDLLAPDGQSTLGTLTANEILYNTMTDTDVTLYRLNTTYRQILQTYDTPALELSTTHPTQGSDIDVISGYWQRTYSCSIDGFVYRLKEDGWTWKDSIRYTSACDTIGGTSGSPIVDPASGKVVGINNTGNDSGGQCTLNNPCEVDENGNITVHQGISYGQQTYILANCIGAGSTVNLDDPGCQLPKPPTTAVEPTFAGTVALSNCSGSLVRVADATDSDPALVLTNGHCIETGFPAAGEVIVDQPSTRSFTVLDASGGSLGTVHASKVSYATMTDTDVTLYQLTSTYGQIQQQYGISALPLASSHPTQGADIRVVSGYWKKVYSCNVDGFVYQVKEGDWTWKDSVRYTQPCQVIGGTSGSPVIDTASGNVVAVNNTINESGEQCTLDNPCEVDENGNITVHEGIGYAQETYILANCISGSTVNLDDPSCQLPRP